MLFLGIEEHAYGALLIGTLIVVLEMRSIVEKQLFLIMIDV